MKKLIAQGAEAKIFLEKKIIIKDRVKKTYRIKELDEQIRKRRTKAETKLLEKASKIINSPEPIRTKEFDKIKMPFIEGEKLSIYLDKFSLKKQKDICKEIGKEISKLHDADIIHGDLTTSNMILCENKIYFIDFGLGYISKRFEDKAVDLKLLKQAINAKHYKNSEELFKEIIKGYKRNENSKKVLNQFIKVEKRGRYKH